MNLTYTLNDVDTTDCLAVEKAVLEIQRAVFPKANTEMISQLFSDVKAMFEGTYWDFQAMDAAYHNLDHTLQATLCWTRLMANRHIHEVEPMMSERDFENGLHGVLLHDIGFLKEKGDSEGTGAKYTFVHEQRSCELAEIYLTGKDWDRFEIFVVQHLISCTGPRSIIDAVPFNNQLERIIGEAICTADYLGQISDPLYKDKLNVLFSEFEESDNVRNVPVEDRIFRCSGDILSGTPYFWEKIVMPKLEEDCHGLYRFLAQPYPDGINPYKQKAEEHVKTIHSETKFLSKWDEYYEKKPIEFDFGG